MKYESLHVDFSEKMKNRATNPQSRQLIIISPTFRWQFLVNFGVDHHFSPLSLAYLGIFCCHDCSVSLFLERSRPSIAADKGAALNFLIFGSCARQLHIGAPIYDIYGHEIIENIWNDESSNIIKNHRMFWTPSNGFRSQIAKYWRCRRVPLTTVSSWHLLAIPGWLHDRHHARYEDCSM